MAIVNVNSISGINSITAQSTSLNFYDSTGNTLSIGASVTGGVTVATGATISGSTNTIVASTNGSERVRITSDGKVSIGGFNPAVAGLSISNSSTNRGLEFDTGSGFDSTSCIRAYDRPTTAYKSLGLTGSDIKFGINDVKKVSITSGGNVEIANGNLVFSTAGTGIDFSATANSSGTVGSEVLSDYEEGTWTPTWVPNAGSIVNSYGSGKYVKVGDMVTLWGYYGFSSSSGVSAGDTIRLGGFPFSTPSTTFGQAATGIGLLHAQYGWNTPPEQTIQLGASATSTEDLLKKGTTFAPGGTKLTYSDLQTSFNYSQIVFWASYRAS